MKTMARLLVGTLLTVLTVSALAEDDWKLVKEDKRNNIKLYLRQEAGLRTKSFRLVGTTKGSIDKYSEVMLDIPRMCEWMYRCKEVKKLKQIGSNEQYVYFLYDAPYGLEDRDVIVNGVYQFDKSKGFLRTRSDLNYLPPTPGVVRMTRYDIELNGREVNGDELELSMEGNIDPGGKVPLWAVNLVQLDGPYSTIKKLMRIVRREEAAEEREEVARERERERDQARRRERSRDDDAERESRSAEKELAKRPAEKEREQPARPVASESKPATPAVATPSTAEPTTEPAPSSAPEEPIPAA